MTSPAAFRVACVQNRATGDVEEGTGEAVTLAREAAERGADLICLPEFFSCLEVRARRLHVDPHPEDEHPVVARMRALAAEIGRWVLAGSVAVEVGSGGMRNRSLLLDAAGDVVARYDKIHLFDVDLSETERYRESDQLAPGERAVLAPTPWGPLGLTVCYDVRFPALYRALAQAGAVLLAVPAAFTRVTGEAHWHALLRARAIETGSYVVAPGQYGRHGDGETYAHSLIVDPWGEILADAGEGPAVVVAEVDPARVAETRRRIPALAHDRRFAPPERVAPAPARRSAG